MSYLLKNFDENSCDLFFHIFSCGPLYSAGVGCHSPSWMWYPEMLPTGSAGFRQKDHQGWVHLLQLRLQLLSHVSLSSCLPYHVWESSILKTTTGFYSGNYAERLGRPYKKGRPCNGCPNDCEEIRGRKGQKSRKRHKKKKVTTLTKRLRLLRRKRKLFRRMRVSKRAIYRRNLKKSKRRKRRSKSSTNYLCTNACQYADLWVNCQELVEHDHDWICKMDGSLDSLKRFTNCKATCTCKDKIRNVD